MKHFLMILLLPVCLGAQVNRIFEFDMDGSDRAQRVVNLIQLPNVQVKADPVVKLVSIVADTQEKAQMAEDLFRRYYKASQESTEQNIEITTYILFAKSGEGENKVPAVLEPVVRQLRQTTTLTSFLAVESQTTRQRSGKRLQAAGVLPWTGKQGGDPLQYQMSAEVTVRGGSIRFDRLMFGFNVPFRVDEKNSFSRSFSIESSFDMKAGQTVVVGKGNSTPEIGSVILVISARLVD